MLLAGTQFLCFGEYVLYQGTSTYHINSCETIEVFYKLRTDLDKLKYASHITKIVSDVTTENENSYKILQLFLNTLYTVSELDKNLGFVLAVFKIRLMALLGFVPNLIQCSSCKEKENLRYFSFKDSSIKCEICGRQDKGAIELLDATLVALRYIISAPAKKLFSFQVSEAVEKELTIIAKLYTNEKLEKEYRLEDLF